MEDNRFTVMPDSELMVTVTTGNDDAWTEVQTRFRARVAALAARRAPDFSSSDIEEVVEEVWVQLIESPTKPFDPSRGSLDSFIAAKVMTGIQRVWSSSHPPDLPGKLPRLVDRRSNNASLDAVESGTPVSAFADWRRPFDLIDDRIDAGIVVRAAEPAVVVALLLIRGGLTFSEAATRAHLTRFTLRRKLDSLAERFSGQSRGDRAA